MKYIFSLLVCGLLFFTISFATDMVFLGQLQENLNGYIGGTSFVFAGDSNATYVYIAEADCGETTSLIGKTMSVDSIGTTKGLDCIEKQCSCIFIKDVGGFVSQDICLGELTQAAQVAWKDLAASSETSLSEMPVACAIPLEEQTTTCSSLPKSNNEILSEKHRDYAKNLARKLRYLDKEYIKNFFLYVIELL